MHGENMTAAVIQMQSTDDFAENLRRAETLIRRAARQGAALIVLPECCLFRGAASFRKIFQEVAETLRGPSVRFFQQLSSEIRRTIVLGSIHEKDPSAARVRNTMLVIDERGEILAAYRKRHLFAARLSTQTICEADVFSPGRRGRLWSQQGFRFASAICYDLRFPGDFEAYARQGCDAFVIPSNFTYETGQDHWEVLLRARAIEHKCYILAPNQAGTDSRGLQAYGNSMIIDPWGKILARAKTRGEAVLTAPINTNIIKAVRLKLS